MILSAFLIFGAGVIFGYLVGRERGKAIVQNQNEETFRP
jgi:hypothetical protein